MREDYVNEHEEIMNGLQNGEDFIKLYVKYSHIWNERGIESISQAALYFAGIYKPSK